MIYLLTILTGFGIIFGTLAILWPFATALDEWRCGNKFWASIACLFLGHKWRQHNTSTYGASCCHRCDKTLHT